VNSGVDVLLRVKVQGVALSKVCEINTSRKDLQLSSGQGLRL